MLESVFSLFAERSGWFLDLLVQHIVISLVSILLATAIGLSLGIAISEWRRGARPVLGLVNFVYTIPSIALFGFLIPLTGVGNVTAVVALTVYALLPMVRSTYTGITGIDPRLIEAARGMGSTGQQLLYRVQLPLAAPVIMNGLRTMSIMTIALAGIASFIGAGGLGVAIYRGITTNNLALTVAGSILIAVLALVVDALLGAAERAVKRPRRTSARRRATQVVRSACAGDEPLVPRRRRRGLAVGAVVLAVALVAGGSWAFSQRPENPLFGGMPSGTVNIATKPMTEQFILGEMLVMLIEQDTSLNANLTPGVGGGTSAIHPAMERGDFDIYPEYTGTAWNAVLGYQDFYTEDMFGLLQSNYTDRYGFTWLGMYGFNNTYTLAVSSSVAEQYNLRTFSDLAQVAGELRLGAEPDFFDRQDGYPGISRAYNMNFGQTMDMDIGLKYQALAEGQVDAIVVYTTDGQLASSGVTVLEDDQSFYPSYRCGNVVRLDTLSRHPELRATLTKLEGTISDASMSQMNHAVEEEGQEPRAVAQAFLEEKGLM